MKPSILVLTDFAAAAERAWTYAAVLVAPLVGAPIGAPEGAVVGGSAAALVSLRIPEDSVLEYETETKTGKYILLVHGSLSEVNEARGILGLTAAVGV